MQNNLPIYRNYFLFESENNFFIGLRFMYLQPNFQGFFSFSLRMYFLSQEEIFK